MAKPVNEWFGLKVICVTLAFACASPPSFAKLTKERRLLRHFDGIEVRGTVNVFVTQEKRLREAMVYADDSVLESVVTEVRGRTLVVEAQNVSTYKPRLPFVRIAFTAIQPVEVIVSTEELGSVTVTGEGGFTGANLKAKTFRVFSVGTGKVHLDNLTADEVEVRMESDGDVFLKGGVVEQLRVNMTGKGSLRAIDLPALRTHVSISGSGDAEVRAENWLEARLAGKGDLRYLGHPVNTFLQADGEGQIQRIDPAEAADTPFPRKKEESSSPDKEKRELPEEPKK